MEKKTMKEKILWFAKGVILTAAAGFFCLYADLLLFVVTAGGLWVWLSYALLFILPALFLAAIWGGRYRKKLLKFWAAGTAVLVALCGVNLGWKAYQDSITVNTSPNINVHEYLPFDEDSKIVRLSEESTLHLSPKLPVVDGAAAVFPVYSAFVSATYPDTVDLYDGCFEYNNTVGGYMLLAEKATDIFFGAYPSEEQIAYAEEKGTEFVYTPIGSEAFVFFVHKDNPVDSLTSEQLRGIYSGQITNWKEVGGKNEPIAAFQRNEGSGSQSMLLRFMGDTPVMDPPSELVNDLMSGIVEKVSHYKSKSGSIGFSYRYYMEGIIQNPDIKLLAVDGVAPTVENISTGAYPITASLYAVTWADNPNENVQKLLDWVLGPQGQYLIEATGYVPLQ